ncbi:lipopolysaccharide biosynthesis protein [candidate division KSB1 bacterium]|nr:lipopolysaccharide biosynthesis protein [candidate division KSB1 bacterium]
MSSKSQSVSEKAKLGIIYATMSKFSGTFMQFFGSVALARLLEVSDFGLVQMGTMIIGFATKLGEFGFNMGLVQRREEVREEHVNTLFIMDFLFKLTLFGIVMLALPYLAEYFHEPRLEAVMPAIALYMVLDCFSNPGTTMLDRQMNFGAQARIQIIERFIEITTSVGMAFAGMGVWSLIYSKIIAISVSAILASRAAHWRPSLKFDFQASKELFRFGGWIFFRNMCREMADNVDYFIIGRYLNAQQLGYYTKAFDLMRLPQRRITRSINSVMFAAFARVQDQPEKVRAGFEKAVLAVSLVSYPLLIGMLIVAREFVEVVFGEKWLPMTLPLQIMCVAGVLRSIDPFLNSVVTATGFVRHTAFRRLVEFALLAVACYIGVQYGIVGVSIAVVIVSFIVMFLMVNLLKQVSISGWREYLAPQMPAFGGSVLMAITMLVFQYVSKNVLHLPALAAMIGMTIIGSLTYLGVLWLTKPKRVIALWQESAQDVHKLTGKARGKIRGVLGKLGMATTIK